MPLPQPELEPQRRRDPVIDPDYESFDHAKIERGKGSLGYGVTSPRRERKLEKQRAPASGGNGGTGGRSGKPPRPSVTDDFLSDPDSSEWPEGVSAKERDRQVADALRLVNALPDLDKATSGGYEGAHELFLGSLGLKPDDLLTLDEIKANVEGIPDSDVAPTPSNPQE